MREVHQPRGIYGNSHVEIQDIQGIRSLRRPTCCKSCLGNCLIERTTADGYQTAHDWFRKSYIKKNKQEVKGYYENTIKSPHQKRQSSQSIKCILEILILSQISTRYKVSMKSLIRADEILNTFVDIATPTPSCKIEDSNYSVKYKRGFVSL